MTLVSVVTPTLPGRETLLRDRCMPSIAEQDWRGPIDHIIVSDPNPDLRDWFHDHPKDGVRFIELGDNWRNPTTEQCIGGVPWMIGSYLALGEFVAFCGDDDELKPHHITSHVEAMRDAGAMWSVSQVQFCVNGEPWVVIGDPSFELGHLDATGVMCFKHALSVARWNPNGQNATDWQMVNDWRQAGLVGVFVEQVTAIHHDGWAAGRSGKP